MQRSIAGTLRICQFLLCAFATSVVEGGEPGFLVQSAGLQRLVEVTQALGLPDPIATLGLDTNSTLDRFDDYVKLDRTCGTVIYLRRGQPCMIVCLPMADATKSEETIKSVLGPQAQRLDAGVFSSSNETKMFATTSAGHLLLADNRAMLMEATSFVQSSKWTATANDIHVRANLKSLDANDRVALLNELTTLTTSTPAGDLTLNGKSIQDWLRFGMHHYLLQSLIDCWTVDAAINLTTDKSLNLSIQTTENVAALQTRSAYFCNDLHSPKFVLDFTTALSDVTRQSVLDGIRRWESSVMDAIQGDEVSVTDDLEIAKLAVKLLTQTARQCCAKRPVDAFLVIGQTDSGDYVAGALGVNEAPNLANMLNRLVSAGNALGWPWKDVRSASAASNDQQADIVIALPGVSGISDLQLQDGSLLRIKIADGTVSMSIGEEGERIRKLACENGSKNPPATNTLLLDLGPEHTGELTNVLPLKMRTLRLDSTLTDSGRKLVITLGRQSSASEEHTVSFDPAKRP